VTENTDADSLGAALLDRNDGLRKYRRGPGSNGIAFYVPEADKHPVPDGKYVKVQCVHKSVPRIIE
jgi:hypothetical protein